MQFIQITGGSQNLVTAYADDHIAVRGMRYERGLIVRPDRLLPDWPVSHVGELTLDSLRWLQADPPEILLIGTGARPQFPKRDLWRLLRAQGWGVEIMGTDAACRTYNLIVAEDRAVAAALIIGEAAHPPTDPGP